MMKSHGPARRLLLAALLSLCAAPALPQSSGRYTVEIVVFRNTDTGLVLPDAGAADAITGDDVVATPVSAGRLTGAASKLRNAGGFRVLAHAAWTQGPTAWNSRRGVSAAQLGLGSDGIAGKIFLEKGQYLHFGVDLTVEDGGHRYHISEVRRVKPDEVHYFDHPAVGVLAIVSAAPAGDG